MHTLYRDKIDMVIEMFVCAQFYLIIGTYAMFYAFSHMSVILNFERNFCCLGTLLIWAYSYCSVLLCMILNLAYKQGRLPQNGSCSTHVLALRGF